jgi:cellobiose phosphorylase
LARSFPRRAWISYNESYGENEIWLEPQGYALQIPEMSQERKQRLFTEVEKRLINGEALGARQQENPPVYDVRGVAEPGTRENGGFWFSLNGPLILGVASFDRGKSWSLLRRMTFANFATRFPNYWSGRWTNADAVDSSVSPHKGMTPVIGLCAHPHAWPLYCYLRLKESQ